MASISSLVSYGGSDSEAEEEERGDTGGGGGVKETAVSFKKTGLIKYQKDTSGKVKVYLPELDHKEIARTDKETKKLSSTPTAQVSGGRGLASVLPPPKKRKTTNSLPSPSVPGPSPSAPPPVSDRPVPVGLFVPYSLKKSKTATAEQQDDETDNDFTSFLFLKEEDKKEDEDLPHTPPVDHHRPPTGYQPVNSPTSLTGSSNIHTLTGSSNIHTLTGSGNIDVLSYGSGNVSTLSPPSLTGSSNISQDASSDDNLPLNDDIVRRLAGKRRGQRLDDESLSILNVKSLSETDLKNSVNAFQKSLTEQSANSGTMPENLVYSSDAKRKHQITWLAHQAKSREVELKNFWSDSAAVRKQAKMKYGF